MVCDHQRPCRNLSANHLTNLLLSTENSNAWLLSRADLVARHSLELESPNDTLAIKCRGVEHLQLPRDEPESGRFALCKLKVTYVPPTLSIRIFTLGLKEAQRKDSPPFLALSLETADALARLCVPDLEVALIVPILVLVRPLPGA